MIANLKYSKLKVLLAYFIPFLALLLFVASFGVNVPFWDEWETVTLFEKVYTGTVSFWDLFVQHNEHRIFFPRLVFIALAFISKWNLKYEMYFNVFLAAVTFIAMYKISQLTKQNKHSSSAHLTNILTCLLVFSLLQYENWLWGFQIAWFLVNSCLVIATLIIALSQNFTNRIYLAVILCFIASLSSAHGLLTWISLIPAIASLDGSYKQRRNRIALWILCFATTCGIYFIGYQKPNDTPSMFFLIKEPLAAANYFFTLLGSPVVQNIVVSPIAGIIIFSIYLFLVAHFLKNDQSKLKWNLEVASWVSIGLFAVLFSFMTTVGRAGFGVEQAMSSRYTTPSLLLVISIIHLLRLALSGNSFIVGIITGTLLITSISATTQGSLLQLQRKTNENCLELVNFLEGSPDCLAGLFPSTSTLRTLAKKLERVGFREFPKDIGFIPEPDKLHGYFDFPPTGNTTSTSSKRGSLNAIGWAILPDSLRAANTVLFSHDSNKTFFANTVVNLESPDVAKAFNSSRYEKVRWTANISLGFLQVGETVLKAWVYDSNRKQVVKLTGEPRIEVVE